MSQEQWAIIANVFACIADDIHESDYECTIADDIHESDYECTEDEAREISAIAMAAFISAT